MKVKPGARPVLDMQSQRDYWWDFDTGEDLNEDTQNASPCRHSLVPVSFPPWSLQTLSPPRLFLLALSPFHVPLRINSLSLAVQRRLGGQRVLSPHIRSPDG